MGVASCRVFAESGFAVRMIDVSKEVLQKSLARVEANLNLFREFDLLKEPTSAILSRIEAVAASDLAKATSGCDFIVESIPGSWMPSGRSSRNWTDRTGRYHRQQYQQHDMDTITEGMKSPQRMVGLHYFNPAHIIPAVESIWAKRPQPKWWRARGL